MAVTAEGRELTEAHRIAQIDLGEDTIRDVEAAWKLLLDPKRIEATFPDYFETAFAVLDRDHVKSSALASTYLEAFHSAEGFETKPLDLRHANDLAVEQAMNSLFFTGPVQIRYGVSKMGRTVDHAAEVALSQALRASKRLSLQGGRKTITRTSQATRAIKGVARVTDASPCYFCAMLASRGAVYKSEQTASFNPHDGCGCEPEPVYSKKDYMVPGRAQEFSDMWRQIPGGLSPANSRRAFRGLYETGSVPAKYLNR